jgi:hypothetical protein
VGGWGGREGNPQQWCIKVCGTLTYLPAWSNVIWCAKLMRHRNERAPGTWGSTRVDKRGARVRF